MRVADDNVFVKLGPEIITLRPSLRCAMRLERYKGSFAKLIADLDAGSLTACTFILREFTTEQNLEADIMKAGLEKVGRLLVGFVILCAGLDGSSVDNAGNREADHVTFAEHLDSLYRVATGWLGWPPNVALDATPAEISEAHKGRVEMLNAIFGGGNKQAEFDPENLKAALREISRPVRAE